jgi:hypothetical protein
VFHPPGSETNVPGDCTDWKFDHVAISDADREPVSDGDAGKIERRAFDSDLAVTRRPRPLLGFDDADSYGREIWRAHEKRRTPASARECTCRGHTARFCETNRWKTSDFIQQRSID